MIENGYTHYITIFTFLISVICVVAISVMIGIAIFDRRHKSEEANDRKELLTGIKIAVKDLNKLNPSMEGQEVSISDLCFLLPSYKMEDIVSALQDFEDVKTLDAATGLIYFPQHTFES